MEEKNKDVNLAAKAVNKVIDKMQVEVIYGYKRKISMYGISQ